MKIRYYGHAGQLTGYGRAAEGMCHALIAGGAELEIRSLAPYDTLDFSHDLPLANHVRTDAGLDPNPDVVIVHTLPMDCVRVFELAEPTIGGQTATWIAYTTWEALRAPDGVCATLEGFDQVWTPSKESASAFAGSELPVRVIPHCFDETKLAHYRERVRPGARIVRDGAEAAPGDPRTPFRFYAIGAFNARKNPLAIIRAFAHAFPKGADVELLLACGGMTIEHLSHAICATGIPPHELPPIRSDFRTLTDLELWTLHRGADCFVSASRGEAWNLPAFEAVLAGRMVIAPADLGSDQFLDGTSALRYGSTLAPAMVETRVVRDAKGTQIQTVGAQGLTSRLLWREPDILELARAMQDVYRAQASTLDIRYDLGARFGYKAIGELALATIAELGRELST
jgi:glycosyltransferase involved in cell wall biosynthesis